MGASERYNILLKSLIDSGVVIEPKKSKWYWKALAGILWVISFGQIKFLDTSTTTIGTVIGTPTSWDSYTDAEKYETLLHEQVHIAQYKRFGFGNAWIGIIPVGFAYLFLPFPIGIAYCRAKLEQEGYEESIRAIMQLQGLNAVLQSKTFFISQFTSSNYLWMWPFTSDVERWFNFAVKRIAIEEGKLSG